MSLNYEKRLVFISVLFHSTHTVLRKKWGRYLVLWLSTYNSELTHWEQVEKWRTWCPCFSVLCHPNPISKERTERVNCSNLKFGLQNFNFFLPFLRFINFFDCWTKLCLFFTLREKHIFFSMNMIFCRKIKIEKIVIQQKLNYFK